ncbi:MAG: helix-turn-helix transcriptional regulator [Clostridia bacterium]
MKQFSNRLIALRKERDMTQANLAKAVNMKRSTVSGYEIEGKEPRQETLCSLAQYFGVTTDYLLGLSDSRTHEEAVFQTDAGNFKAVYDGLPRELKDTVAKLYDDFYVLLCRDMKLRREEQLNLYQEFMNLLQSSRNEIKLKVESGGEALADPLYLSELMTLQSNLKNNVASLLDQLMQVDMEVAYSLKKEGKSASSRKSAI